MIYEKIWCLVKPAVGIPIFLGAVATGSFLVHLAIPTNTTWLPKFLEGGNKVVAAAPAPAAAAPPAAAPAAPAKK